MYKALFELSPTRADFLSRLFSRPLSGVASRQSDASVEELFAAIAARAAERFAVPAQLDAIYDRLTKATTSRSIPPTFDRFATCT